MDYRLHNGDRVCIVGGGPSGCFSALHLLELARDQDLQLEVLIFEPRDFTVAGAGGCNCCAGILSSRLLHAMDDHGWSIPREIIRAEVQAYASCNGSDILRIERPDPSRRIVSVYRGGGPRAMRDSPISGLDAYLLSLCRAAGATIIPDRVRQISWQGRPVVRTANSQYTADLMVLATGINSRSVLDPHFAYRPPETETMVQREVLCPPSWPRDQVTIFFDQRLGLVFGALIPKGEFMTLSLLGHNLTKRPIGEYLRGQALSDITVPTEARHNLCLCSPRVAAGPARTYFGDRWVSVGDAAITRLYKDGIGSAYFTARAAMQTAVHSGVSHRAFRHHYARYCRNIQRDNSYGRVLFSLWAFVSRTPRLLEAWRRTIRHESAAPQKERIHIRILWGMFTGDEAYRDLFWLALNPRSMAGLARHSRTKQ